MPAANQIDPTSLRSRIRLFFATNGGGHRTMDVATALGDPPDMTRKAWVMKVGTECARMARAGLLARDRESVEGRKVPITRYRFVAPSEPAQKD